MRRCVVMSGDNLVATRADNDISRGVNDPILSRAGATPRCRRRGRSHHGLLTNRRHRGVMTGGRVRRPIAAMLRGPMILAGP